MTNNSFINIIDCRSELLAAKKNHELFLKTDSHWNNLGCFIGYTKLMNTIKKDFPDIKVLTTNDFTITYRPGGNGGNMQRALNILNYPYRNDYVFGYKHGYTFKYLRNRGMSGIITTNEKPDRSQRYQTVIMRDSNLNAMHGYLSESFSYAYYRWGHFFNEHITKEVLDQYKPQIFIHEIAELYMFQLTNDQPPLKPVNDQY